MSTMVVLGFGCIEEQMQSDVKEAIHNAVHAGKDVQAVLQEWNTKADMFNKQPRETAPERYTRIWYDGETLTFHHINRRYPFSPDGWALLIVEEPFDPRG